LVEVDGVAFILEELPDRLSFSKNLLHVLLAPSVKIVTGPIVSLVPIQAIVDH
jgi:hypothetical protein